MAVIGTVSAAPTASAVRTDTSSRPIATTVGGDAAAPAPAAAGAPAGASASKPQPGPSDFSVFRLSAHYDEAAHRVILEARDPISGVVVYQQPPQSAFKQLLASVSPLALSPRGGTVDAAV